MKKIILLLIISIFLASNISQAQTVDDFNYAGNLNANGWSTHSGSGSNVIATTTGLSYSGYINSGIGNAALLKNLGGEDINYTAGVGTYNTNGTTVYFSFMVNVTESSTSKTGDYFIHIGDRTSATSFTSFSARVFERVVSGSVNFGISNTSTAAYGTTNFSRNTTYLMVVKYTINTSGNDRADLWVLSSGIPSSETAAGSPELSSTTTAGQDVIDALALRQGSSTTSVQTVVDGIRIAKSWNDLLFIPQATSATSIVATSFNANWNSVGGASGYYLDVSTDNTFADPTQFASGFNNKDVGNVTTYSVTGLTAGVTYYYRVRAYDASANAGPSSNTISVTTIQLILGSTEAAALNYTEGDPATVITASTVITSSIANLTGGVVQITNNYLNGQDVLAFTNVLPITGSWDATTGKLTLSGTDTYSNYQAAIRSVTYQNTSQNPSTLQRTASFTVSIGSFNSNTVTRNISITPVNQAPVLAAIELAALSYSTGAGKQITNTVTAEDVDNTTMSSATVQITGNYTNGQDLLLFTNQNGISGNWTAATGTLVLSGSSSVANYQAALRSVQFQNTSVSANTLQRTVSFTLNDGTANSNVATRNIDINNTPVLASIEGTQLSYAPGDPATPITSSITVNDPDPANLAGAIVQFSGYYEWGKDVLAFTNANGITGSWNATNGVLTLTGASSVANYQTALRSVTYKNTSATPVKLIRTISFIVNDGVANSNAVTRDINLGFTPPTLSGVEITALLYKQSDGEKNISNSVTISSPSSPFMNSATIKITGSYKPGEDILTYPSQNQIVSEWDPNSGQINLSWISSVANYEAALRGVTYKNISSAPNTSTRTVSFTVSDGFNTTNTVTRNINVSKITIVTITTIPQEGGTVTGRGSYFSGNNVVVTATPNSGYHFVNWTEGGTEVSANTSYTFTINANRTLTANFALQKCTAATTSNPTDGGTTAGDGTFDYGTSVTVIATPNQGYEFVNWTSNGTVVSTSASYTFTINGNLNLVANFMMLPILTVTPDFVAVDHAAGTGSFTVTNSGGGTMAWAAVSDIFWIKIKSGAAGSNNGTINFSYDHNNSASRIGTITITAAGISGSPKVVEVRQNELATYVETLNMGIPNEFKLDQNYPNPFNPSTKIRYGLPKESNVVLTVHNILGEEVARLVDGYQNAGYYEANFAATNLSSGIYVYRISAGNYIQIKKMLLMK